MISPSARWEPALEILAILPGKLRSRSAIRRPPSPEETGSAACQLSSSCHPPQLILVVTSRRIHSHAPANSAITPVPNEKRSGGLCQRAARPSSPKFSYDLPVGSPADQHTRSELLNIVVEAATSLIQCSLHPSRIFRSDRKVLQLKRLSGLHARSADNHQAVIPGNHFMEEPGMNKLSQIFPA